MRSERRVFRTDQGGKRRNFHIKEDAVSKNIMRLISVILVVSVFLAACGTPAAESVVEEPAAEEPAVEDEAAEEPVDEEPVSEDVVTIDFWLPSGRGRDEGLAAVVEAFEAENPNIKVELSAFPFNEYLNTLQVALAGNEPPDVSFTNGVEIQNLAYQGALLPLDDVVSEEDRADFMTDLVEMVSFDGQMYGLPFQNSAVAMYYNTAYFEEAGIDVPQTLDEGWTWEEFAANVKVVQADQAEKGNEVWGVIGLQNPIRATFFAWTMVRSFSEPSAPLWQGISDDYTTVAGYIDTPEAMEAYEFYKSLYTEGIAPLDDIPDAFGNGTAATYIALPPTYSQLRNTFPELEFGVMPFPYGKTPITHTGSFAPTVTAKSDNPEAAKAFVAFMASQEGYLAYHAVTPVIPGRVSLKDQLPEYQEEGPLSFLFDEMVEWGVARPGGPGHTIFNSVIAQSMMIDIALGGDIESVVENAIIEAEAQLAQFE